MASKVLETCGCVSFYMLHDDSTEICGLDRFQCAEDAKENFNNNRDNFECFDPCNKVAYEVKNVVDESIIIYYKELDEGIRKSIDLHGEPIDFEIQFAKNFLFPVKRKKLFSNADILGLVGGFLGLFAGVSILSMIEIIFHMLKKSESAHETEDEKKCIKNLGSELFRESSIHGFNYIEKDIKFTR